MVEGKGGGGGTPVKLERIHFCTQYFQGGEGMSISVACNVCTQCCKGERVCALGDIVDTSPHSHSGNINLISLSALR